jgi:Fibronectin type III domain
MSVRDLRTKVLNALSEMSMKHQRILVFFAIGLFLVSGFAGIGLVAPGAAAPSSAVVAVHSGQASSPPPPSGPTLPYEWAYTIHNAYARATGPYDQLILIDPAVLGSTYLAANLSNTEWSYPNGTLIPSWIQENATTSATATPVWLRLDSLQGNAYATVYLLAQGSAFVLNPNGPSGEAPSLSSSYAKFDNGAEVFAGGFYTNFTGTSLPKGVSYTPACGAGCTVSNGLSITACTSSNCGVYAPFNTTANSELLSNYTITTVQDLFYGWSQTTIPVTAGRDFAWGFYPDFETEPHATCSTATVRSGCFGAITATTSTGSFTVNATWTGDSRLCEKTWSYNGATPAYQLACGTNLTSYKYLPPYGETNSSYVSLWVFSGWAGVFHYWAYPEYPLTGNMPTTAAGSVSGPPAPTSVEAVATGLTSCEVTWSAPPNLPIANSTVVWGTSYGSPSHQANVASGTSTSLTGLALNTTYYTYVESWSSSGTSVASGFGAAGACRTLAQGPPIVSNATLSAAGVSLTSVTLSWEPPANVTVLNYTVYYGTTYHTTFSGFASSSNAGLVTTDTITGLTLNTTYYFVLASWTSATVRGPPSNVAVAHTLGRAPLEVIAPVLTASASGLTSAVLTWSAPTNVTTANYTLYYSTSYANPLTAGAVNAGNLLYGSITGLSRNTTYYVQVDSWTSATVRGPYSNIVTLRTLSGPAPIVEPAVLSASSVSLTSVALTWTGPANVSVTNYTLYYSTSYANPETGGAVSESTALDATVTGLSANTTYYLQVGTWTSATVRGPYTNIVPVHTLARVPLIVKASVLSGVATSLTTADLTWTAPANVTVLNYTLYRGTSYASPLTGTPVSESGALDASVTGLSPNTTYFFEVGTWTSATVRGPYSNLVTIQTTAGPAKIIPENFTLSGAAYYNLIGPQSSLVALAWSAPANVTVVNYTLLEAPLGGPWSSYAPTSVGTSTSVTDSMTGNDTFLFQVESWVSATVRGPTSNVLVVSSPEFASIAPHLSVAGITTSSIAVTWTAAQNQTITNYTLVYSTTGPTGPFNGRLSEGSSLSATVSSLAPDTTYWLRIWGWDSGVLVLVSNVGPAHTLAPTPPAPIIPVSLTIPQVVVISTFMALIVAGLIAAGTRNRGRPKRRGYPVED